MINGIRKAMSVTIIALAYLLQLSVQWGIIVGLVVYGYDLLGKIYSDKGLIIAALGFVLSGIILMVAFYLLSGLSSIIFGLIIFGASKIYPQNAPPFKMPLLKSTNWFGRHLNWTMIFAWTVINVHTLVPDIAYSYFINNLAEPWYSVAKWTLVLYLFAIFVFLTVVIGWAIKQKNRSLWHLLWLLTYIGVIVPVMLDNHSVIVTGDSGINQGILQ